MELEIEAQAKKRQKQWNVLDLRKDRLASGSIKAKGADIL